MQAFIVEQEAEVELICGYRGVLRCIIIVVDASIGHLYHTVRHAAVRCQETQRGLHNSWECNLTRYRDERQLEFMPLLPIMAMQRSERIAVTPRR